MLKSAIFFPTIVAYPLAHTNCGVTQTIQDAPERIVTMNQGATEFLLGLGLADRMVGTAYIDDEIWPQYSTEYAGIPVLAESYPDQAALMAANPDFIVASYRSAFYQKYVDSRGRDRGIFLTEGPVGPCAGPGSEYEGDHNWTTCRPQLHNLGIGTFLFSDACEDEEHRPTGGVTEQMVYDEVRAMASVFDVNADALIADMQEKFDGAAAFVAQASPNQPMTAVWIDCVGRCCDEGQIFVGAGAGAPQMLMSESGLTNTFASEDGNWACVDESRLIDADPDVLVLVHAAWDTAIDKAIWLYNHSALCSLPALTHGRLVTIPFSATTIGPRNGGAAFDLAIAANHVRSGSLMASQHSGVGSFNPHTLETSTRNLRCTLDAGSVEYSEAAQVVTDAEVAAVCESGVLELCYSCSSSHFVGNRANCPTTTTTQPAATSSAGNGNNNGDSNDNVDVDGCLKLSLQLLIWLFAVAMLW